MKDLVTDLNALDYVSLQLATSNRTKDSLQQSDPTLYSFWKLIDYTIFKRRKALTDNSEQEIVVENVGVLNVNNDVDLIVWLAKGRPPGNSINKPKFGVWGLANSATIYVGLIEQVSGAPVISCELVRFGTNSDGDVALTTAYVATDPLSVAASLCVVRARDRGMLLTMIHRVNLNGSDALKNTTRPLSVSAAGQTLSLVTVVAGLAKVYARYLQDLVRRRLHFNQWQLAIRMGGDRLDCNDLTRVKPDHHGFWADPFVAHREGRTTVFFEEMPSAGDRGEILYFDVSDDGTIGEALPALKRDYHLSYPFMFEYDGELFMTPECADTNRIEAYRCVQYPNQWELHAVLLDGLRAFDPTLVEHNGKWWMFITIQKNGNSPNDELHLYHASGPFSKWYPHPLNPINVDVRSARPGGALFKRGGELFRPAQDCSVRYGSALSINKIVTMTEEDYVEEVACRILPDSPDFLGTHTVNQAAGVTIYDCFVKQRFDGARSEPGQFMKCPR